MQYSEMTSLTSDTSESSSQSAIVSANENSTFENTASQSEFCILENTANQRDILLILPHVQRLFSEQFLKLQISTELDVLLPQHILVKWYCIIFIAFSPYVDS